ncbi:MAG: M3 family metallopeptidase, partial [Chitinophagales bacterium]
YRYYDTLKFKNGNPRPQVSFEEMMANMQKMYSELSLETDEFSQFMLDNKLLDLKTRKGKYTGGYLTAIAKHALPFILANFDGTEFDFMVLTHEMGHAFQYYQTRKNGINQAEYLFASMDASEIHSIGMELFTWKWYPLFFKDNTRKFQFSKISAQISTILSCCSNEVFQQYLYLNPHHSHEDRNQKWLDVNKQYFPHTNSEAYFGDSDYLPKGCDWQDSSHIINSPFYMIDYALATVCALQFWMKAQEDWQGAWEDYLRLCNVGGTRSFTELLQLANLKSPFEESTLKEVSDFLKDWLDGVEDGEF